MREPLALKSKQFKQRSQRMRKQWSIVMSLPKGGLQKKGALMTAPLILVK